MDHAALFTVLVQCAWGDTEPLISFLGSDEVFMLTRDERKHLARVLRHAWWKPRPGRRRNNAARYAVMIAEQMFTDWKQECKSRGISDWGRRKEMKDEVCRRAINLMREQDDGVELDFETVRQLMDRSASRRSTRRPPRKVPPKWAGGLRRTNPR